MVIRFLKIGKRTAQSNWRICAHVSIFPVFLSILHLLKGNIYMELQKEVNLPEWAKSVVWYQIFPERFRNGDPSNDPRIEDIKGAWPHDTSSPWQIHPWTSDWYELQPYEKRNEMDIWLNLQRRRYGGDLQGVIDKLDYLEDLGIGAIYLNPVFAAPSSHKYDGSTYHHIDPNFGPDPVGDREKISIETPEDPSTWVWTEADTLALELIDEIHRRKMRVIFDGVFNHMGITSWAFQDVKSRQAQSKFRDWFKITSWANPQTGKGKFTYKGWYGVNELPELKQDENGIVDGPRRYIFEITKRWMDPDGDGDPRDGIDGWRLDVAFCIKHPFWRDWRRHVKSINPDAYLTAEVVRPIPQLKPYLCGDEFDAVMNYNFAFACAEYFIATKKRISTSDFDRLLKDLRQAFSPEIAYVQQNLFDSHDTNRLASHIVNSDLAQYRDWARYHKLSLVKNKRFNTRKPLPEELVIQKLMIIFQMTYVGAPMIYYGDETGMWGGNDPCCRKPMVWDDLHYDDEVYLPDGGRRAKADKVIFSRDLHDFYKTLIRIRNDHPSLTQGTFESFLIDDEKEVYGFCRKMREENILVVLNNGSTEQIVDCAAPSGSYTDLLNDETTYCSVDGALEITIPSRWAVILLKDRR